MLAEIDGANSEDLETVFVLFALLCLCGAAYTAYLRNLLATGLLVFVAVVAIIFGT